MIFNNYLTVCYCTLHWHRTTRNTHCVNERHNNGKMLYLLQSGQQISNVYMYIVNIRINVIYITYLCKYHEIILHNVHDDNNPHLLYSHHHFINNMMYAIVLYTKTCTVVSCITSCT